MVRVRRHEEGSVAAEAPVGTKEDYAIGLKVIVIIFLFAIASSAVETSGAIIEFLY